MPELEVQLFGALQVIHHGRPLTTLPSPRQQALLAWLLLHPQSPQPRKHIAFAIWPDSDEGQALNNLRRELHHLRRALPDAERYLEITPLVLRWRHDAPYRLDVAQFRQALEPSGRDGRPAVEALERAASLYKADLLCALDDDWLGVHREELHRQAASGLEGLVTRLEESGERTRALHHAQRLLALEPLRESVYARVMRLQFAGGDQAAARRTYHRCVEVLRAELGVAPGGVVQAAYRHLLESEGPLPPVVRGELPLIGRRAEWQRLLRVWQEAAAGTARVLLISGEAGIGKSRLAEALLSLAQAGQARSARTRAYAAEGRLPYAPIRDWLHDPVMQVHLPTLGESWQLELARLLPDLSPPARPA